jgi:predicted nucleic acid-binding protein
MSSPSPAASPKTTAVFDASPIVFLDVLGYADALPRLFRVIVPAAVKAEIAARPKEPGAQVPLRKWALVRAPSQESLARVEREMNAGAGENAAVALALDLKATLVTDDLKARRYARRVGLPVVDMLGIVLILHDQSLVMRSLEEEFDLLERQGMWVSEQLKAGILKRG